jgi:hypothetical protein
VTLGTSLDPFEPDVVAAALAFRRSPAGQGLRVGAIKSRYSRTMGESYLSFGCPWCDALYGHFYLHEAVIDAHSALEDGNGAAAVFEADVVFRHPTSEPQPHWCYPEDGTFCDSPAQVSARR